MNKASSIPTAATLAVMFAGLTAACGDGNTEATRPLPPSPSPTLGSISVTVSTTGVGLDADGYTVTVDGSESQSLPTNGTLMFSDLLPGDHTIELAGMAPNCSPPIESYNPQLVSVAPGGTTQVIFNIVCAGVIVDTIL
ncbi:MAG: hypothetical protein O7E49_07745 [Gemmatimonadetes bacterium]|nr:hypothetical protein [Gemmatimonadota bacterium]